MTRFSACSLVLLIGCAAPDMTPAIDEARLLLADTNTSLQPAIAPVAAAELAAAEQAAMAEGKVILDLAGDCDFEVARANGRMVSDCTLVENARPTTGPVNATQVLDAMDALETYFAALGALADARTSAEVGARTKALLDAVGKLDAGKGADGLARIAAAARERSELVGGVAGFVANQARAKALRRVVRRADPVIGRMAEIAAAWLDTQPGNMPAAQEQLLAAQEALILASNPAARATAASELRAAFAAFRKAEAASPATRILLLRRMHAAIAAGPSGVDGFEAVLETLEDIRALIDLAEET
jgi:hypothetical protein